VGGKIGQNSQCVWYVIGALVITAKLELFNTLKHEANQTVQLLTYRKPSASKLQNKSLLDALDNKQVFFFYFYCYTVHFDDSIIFIHQLMQLYIYRVSLKDSSGFKQLYIR
jgi:hypothetical protein